MTPVSSGVEFLPCGPSHPLESRLQGWLEVHATSLFTHPAWWEHFTRHGCAEGARPGLIVGMEGAGGSPQWVAAVDRAPEPGAGAILRACGSLANHYSLEWSIVRAARDGPASADTGLAEWCGRHADLVRWGPLAREQAESLAGALSVAGFEAEFDVAWVHWTEPVCGRSFESWLGDRPSRLRNTWRRKERALRRAHRVELVLTDGRTPAAGRDLERCIADYGTVYARSWKPVESSAAFMPGLLRLAASHGWLRAGLLYVDGRPIAAQCWLQDRGRAVIYKLAHDEGWRDFSPGLILTMAMFRQAIDVDHSQIVDFGSGDDPYKADFMSVRGARWRIDALNRRSGRGRAALAARTLLRRLRREPLTGSQEGRS